jgi:hypothetical protein
MLNSSKVSLTPSLQFFAKFFSSFETSCEVAKTRVGKKNDEYS